MQFGLVIHDDVISNITSLYERGEKALITFIDERLITKVVPFDAPLKAMPLLRHEIDAEKCIYHLKSDDKLESPFSKFVHSNRATLAAYVKECWVESQLIERFPKSRLLVIGRPNDTAIKLQNGYAPIPDCILESTKIEACYTSYETCKCY
ncbi:unnamed protein product [Rotaria sp. Silwood2]|nr:unnamed protein product [Rotaria sp. Silwood2]CAF4570775.1 unnamed protein product [Rotaria sp. Silwood2]